MPSNMRIAYLLIILGIMVLAPGIIFHFQGKGIVGPEVSFMYSNPDWIFYGQQIIIFGAVVLAAGIGLTFLKKS